GVLIGVAALAALLVASQVPAVVVYTARLALAAVALACCTWLLLPTVERAGAALSDADAALVRSLWAITLCAIGVRLAGALYPVYSAHDLPLNVERLVRTIGGTLVSTNRSFEFRSGVTVYPPGPYLALLPAFLPGLSAGLLVQAGNAMVDGLSALATGLLALKLGANRRTAQFAAVLYAGLPVMLTSLYWGHSAQIFGQALMAPLAITLLVAFERPRFRYWAIASALLAAAFLSHIGVTVIAIAWMGALWLLARVRATLAWRPWWHLTLALGAAGIAGLALVYGPTLALKAEQTAQVGERVLHEAYSSQILISRAAVISFYQFGWPLALAGLAFLPRIWSRTRGASDMLVAWIAVALLFCAIELITGLQARYFVFAA
ncbi:MAG TPA: hypothetical protein VFT99_10000, partial [Roseiflexaceae bacterium]|nr:hypothetical protein [Roseiflexaceae bacterium]